jgi:hypothetical protein
MVVQTVLDHFIDWLPFLASLLVVLGGWYLSRNKEKADIVTQIATAAATLIEPLNKRIDELEKKILAQEKELAILRPLPAIVETMSRGIHILITQIRKLGCEPDWTPVDMPPVKTRRNGRSAGKVSA